MNGTWNFAYFDKDIDVPERIEHWDTIEVPACWQILDYKMSGIGSHSCGPAVARKYRRGEGDTLLLLYEHCELK